MKKWEILTENDFGEAAFENLAGQAILATLEVEEVACGGEISLLFVGDEEMQKLNLEYRGKNATTDCLSFPQFTAEEFEKINTPNDFAVLGDIVINVEQARLQAEEFGHSIQRETAFLAVHSLLHLLGHDHEDAEAEQVMIKQQEAVLAKMGLLRGV